MLRKYCLRSSRCPRAGVGPVVLTRGGRHSSSLQRQPFEKQRCAVGDRCPPASSEVSFCLRILRFEDGHRSWDQGMPQTALRIFWPRQLQAHCSAEETLLLIGYWLQPSQRSSRFCTLVVCTVVPPTSHPLLDARLRGVACPDVPGWHVRAACLGSWTPNDPSADHRQQRQQQEHASKMACSRPAEDCSQVPWLSATGSQQWHLDNRSTGWTVMLPAAVVVHHCVSLDAEPIQVSCLATSPITVCQPAVHPLQPAYHSWLADKEVCKCDSHPAHHTNHTNSPGPTSSICCTSCVHMEQWLDSAHVPPRACIM